MRAKIIHNELAMQPAKRQVHEEVPCYTSRVISVLFLENQELRRGDDIQAEP
jgi:hypothetical protein